MRGAWSAVPAVAIGTAGPQLAEEFRAPATYERTLSAPAPSCATMTGERAVDADRATACDRAREERGARGHGRSAERGVLEAQAAVDPRGAVAGSVHRVDHADGADRAAREVLLGQEGHATVVGGQHADGARRDRAAPVAQQEHAAVARQQHERVADRCARGSREGGRVATGAGRSDRPAQDLAVGRRGHRRVDVPRPHERSGSVDGDILRTARTDGHRDGGGARARMCPRRRHRPRARSCQACDATVSPSGGDLRSFPAPSPG